jgi:hypothetical protein
MSELTITRALPNPAGKDRTPAHLVTNQQLNGEWMEFGNTSERVLQLEDVTLSDYTFDHGCQKTGEAVVMAFTGGLRPGYSVRVHTGTGTPADEGTIRHLYAGRGDFVWNNRCGDTGVLRNNRGEVVDYAAYDPNPPDGCVLNRLLGTNKMSAASAAQTA